MTKRRRKRVQLTPDSSVLLGRFGWGSLGNDAINEVRLFASANSLPELRATFDAEVSKEVQTISSAAEDFDAFDLIELMRMRELPLTPVEGFPARAAINTHNSLKSAASIALATCERVPWLRPVCGRFALRSGRHATPGPRVVPNRAPFES